MTPREARKKAKLTQQEMGDKLGVTRQTVARMEHNPSDMTITDSKAWASLCGVEWTDIFFGVEQ